MAISNLVHVIVKRRHVLNSAILPEGRVSYKSTSMESPRIKSKGAYIYKAPYYNTRAKPFAAGLISPIRCERGYGHRRKRIPISQLRNRRFNANLNFSPKSHLKVGWWKFRISAIRSCGPDRWFFRGRESVTMRISNCANRHLMCHTATLWPCVSPPYFRTWEFKCNIHIASYSRQSLSATLIGFLPVN